MIVVERNLTIHVVVRRNTITINVRKKNIILPTVKRKNTILTIVVERNLIIHVVVGKSTVTINVMIKNITMVVADTSILKNARNVAVVVAGITNFFAKTYVLKAQWFQSAGLISSSLLNLQNSCNLYFSLLIWIWYFQISQSLYLGDQTSNVF